MAKWEAALDNLLELYTIWNSPVGVNYADEWIKSWVNGRLDKYTDEEREWSIRKVWANFHERIKVQLWRAEPIYIDDDMMSLIEWAYPSFEPEALLESDLITPSGFVYLPHPLYWVTEDESGKEFRLAYRYILWGIERHKFDSGDYSDVLMISIWRAPQDKDDYNLAHSAFPRLGTLIPWPLDGKTTYGNEKGQWYQIAKRLHPLWRLMQQTITIKTEEKPNRATRKRLEKLKYPERTITVVTLRRPHNESTGEHHDVNWSHRWIVSGHWRKQPYPSLGEGVYRQIWISPYIKGDPNLPLVIREKRVFQLVR